MRCCHGVDFSKNPYARCLYCEEHFAIADVERERYKNRGFLTRFFDWLRERLGG